MLGALHRAIVLRRRRTRRRRWRLPAGRRHALMAVRGVLVVLLTVLGRRGRVHATVRLAGRRREELLLWGWGHGPVGVRVVGLGGLPEASSHRCGLRAAEVLVLRRLDRLAPGIPRGDGWAGCWVVCRLGNRLGGRLGGVGRLRLEWRRSMPGASPWLRNRGARRLGGRADDAHALHQLF